jgi:hypothetical protein
MIAALLLLAGHESRGRQLLIAGATAIVTALAVCVLLLLQVPDSLNGTLDELVQDAEMRGGVATAGALLTIPPVLLLQQAVRLGAVTRERRLAALRLAGATPWQARLIGAFEVGVAAFVGGLLGTAAASAAITALPHVLPAQARPPAWQIGVVVAAVTALGFTAGWRASARVIGSPLQGVRRTQQASPRPWGLVAIAVFVAITLLGRYDWVGLRWLDKVDGRLVVFAILGLVVLGLASLSSWTASVVGRRETVRADTAATLLAARRLAAEPRQAGRATAVIGGIAAVAAGAAVYLGAVLAEGGTTAFDIGAFGLIAAALLAALVLVAGTIAVHIVESMLEQRRTMAALAALGTPVDEIVESLRRQATLVSMPAAKIGLAVGVLPFALLALTAGIWGDPTVFLVTESLTVVAVLILTRLAVDVAVAIVVPWVHLAVSVDGLRAE